LASAVPGSQSESLVDCLRTALAVGLGPEDLAELICAEGALEEGLGALGGLGLQHRFLCRTLAQAILALPGRRDWPELLERAGLIAETLLLECCDLPRAGALEDVLGGLPSWRGIALQRPPPSGQPACVPEDPTEVWLAPGCRPGKLVSSHSLTLDGMELSTWRPEELKVDWSLEFRDCLGPVRTGSLETILLILDAGFELEAGAADLHQVNRQLGPDLAVMVRPGLTRIRSGLRTGDRMHRLDAPRLHTWEGPALVGGELHLTRCPGLRALPEPLVVAGDLVLEDLPALAGLPASLRVGGDLHAGGCGSLVLPVGAWVGGKVTLA